MISKKRRISQIPEIYQLSQTSKLLLVDNGQSVIISAGNLIGSLSSISEDHLTDFNNPHQVTKAQIGLSNVDNTSDLNKPLSTAVINALLTKQNVLVSGANIKTINGQTLLGAGDITISNIITSVNGQTGAVTLTTDNVSEGSKKYYSDNLVSAYADTVYAKLGTVYSNPSFVGSLPWSKLTGLPTTLLGYGITDPIVLLSGTYANPSWITSLDWVKVINKPSFVSVLDDLVDVQINTLSVGQVLRWNGSIWTNEPNIPLNQLSLLTDVTITTPVTGNILLYNGTTWQNSAQSVLSLSKSQVGLANVDNTSDVNKPISTATQTALDSKASTASLSAHTSNTSNPHSVTKAQVGLGNVDNTSDANKPVSTATQTALNLKADNTTVSAHISNTSNPHGVTKAQVGLGNVDNTSDIDKPISSATQSALDDKATLLQITQTEILSIVYAIALG